MLKDLKNLFKHSSIYSIGNISSKILGFILLPLYTGYITVADFGLYALVEVTLQLLETVIPLGLPIALFKWFNNADLSKKDKAEILFTVNLFITLIGLVISVIGVISFRIIHDFGLIDGHIYTLAIISGCIAAVNASTRIPMVYLRVMQWSSKFVAVSVGRFFLQLILTIIGVVWMKLGVYAILLGLLAGELAIFILVYPLMLRSWNRRFRTEELKRMLKFGYPMIFTALSTRFLNLGSRYFLGIFGSTEMVGLYAIAYKIANVIDIVFIRSFNNAFQQVAWTKFDASNRKRFFSKVLTYYVLVIGFLVVAMSLFAGDLLRWMSSNSNYWGAAAVIPVVSLGILFRGAVLNFALPLQYIEKTDKMAVITTVSVGVNVGLNILMIPSLGVMGAAWASVISFVIISLWYYVAADNAYPINYEWKKISIILAVGTAIYFTSVQMQFFETGVRLTVKFAGLSLFPVILYFLNIFEPIELLRMRQSMRKWSRGESWKKALGRSQKGPGSGV